MYLLAHKNSIVFNKNAYLFTVRDNSSLLLGCLREAASKTTNKKKHENVERTFSDGYRDPLSPLFPSSKSYIGVSFYCARY